MVHNLSFLSSSRRTSEHVSAAAITTQRLSLTICTAEMIVVERTTQILIHQGAKAGLLPGAALPEFLSLGGPG